MPANGLKRANGLRANGLLARANGLLIAAAGWIVALF